jgi:hypothetical protein
MGLMGRERSGKPGAPGLPGEPGESGGGRGGAGGRGGRGGDAPRSAVEHYGLLIFLVIVAVALSVGTLLLLIQVQNNADMIHDLEQSNAETFRLSQRAQDSALIEAKQALDAARQAEYRICVRQMINRAVLDTDRHGDERHLPLYDCTPNLAGNPARRLTPAEMRAFGRKVASTPANQLP